MKLLNNFFWIESTEAGELPVFNLSLNPESEIFKAHFPTRPITPGVCQVQMLLEAMETVEHRPLYLQDIKNIKYLAVISPDEVTQMQVRIQRVTRTEGSMAVSAVFQWGDTLYTKISLNLVYEKV